MNNLILVLFEGEMPPNTPHAMGMVALYEYFLFLDYFQDYLQDYLQYVEDFVSDSLLI